MERQGAPRSHVKDWPFTHLNLQVVLRHAASAEAQGEEVAARGASRVSPLYHPPKHLQWRSWVRSGASTHLSGRESRACLNDWLPRASRSSIVYVIIGHMPRDDTFIKLLSLACESTESLTPYQSKVYLNANPIWPGEIKSLRTIRVDISALCAQTLPIQ